MAKESTWGIEMDPRHLPGVSPPVLGSHGSTGQLILYKGPPRWSFGRVLPVRWQMTGSL